MTAYLDKYTNSNQAAPVVAGKTVRAGQHNLTAQQCNLLMNARGSLPIFSPPNFCQDMSAWIGFNFEQYCVSPNGGCEFEGYALFYDTGEAISTITIIPNSYATKTRATPDPSEEAYLAQTVSIAKFICLNLMQLLLRIVFIVPWSISII